jgi:hypothetical protein
VQGRVRNSDAVSDEKLADFGEPDVAAQQLADLLLMLFADRPGVAMRPSRWWPQCGEHLLEHLVGQSRDARLTAYAGGYRLADVAANRLAVDADLPTDLRVVAVEQP